MSTTTRVAACGCPVPENLADEDLPFTMGWHLSENHPEAEKLRRPSIPGQLGWPLRRPTIEECELVDRSIGYAHYGEEPVFLGDGDTVVEIDGDAETLRKFALAFEWLGICDSAHVMPAGVYLEE